MVVGASGARALWALVLYQHFCVRVEAVVASFSVDVAVGIQHCGCLLCQSCALVQSALTHLGARVVAM
jgi:hypothetical protein